MGFIKDIIDIKNKIAEEVDWDSLGNLTDEEIRERFKKSNERIRLKEKTAKIRENERKEIRKQYKIGFNEDIDYDLEYPGATCLNCGRPVKEGQSTCICGYEFRNITCPKCQSKNAYTNKFCTNCSEKLWKSTILDFDYYDHIFHLVYNKLPDCVRNISVYNRFNKSLGELYGHSANVTLEKLKSEKSEIDEIFYEILSRWKVISPNFCINCHNLMKPGENICPKCETSLKDNIRVKSLKNKRNYYIEPVFDDNEIKWTSKNNKNYLRSLAPSIGESQFEYQQRLSCEFAENKNRNYYKDVQIRNLTHPKPVIKPVKKGGICSWECVYYHEDILDSRGGVTPYYEEGFSGVNYYCSLGHSLREGECCKDFQKYYSS